MNDPVNMPREKQIGVTIRDTVTSAEHWRMIAAFVDMSNLAREYMGQRDRALARVAELEREREEAVGPEYKVRAPGPEEPKP